MALTLGIIGAAHRGTRPAQNLMTDERVHLVGVKDVDGDRAETLTRLVKGKTFANVAALLDTGVQAVYVCTPNTLHTAAVLAALQRHVHVFSEKPMATTLQEAQQICAATRTSRGLYQIGHNRRLAPVDAFAQQKRHARLFPTSAHPKVNRGELTQPPWVADTRVTGGFLYESTVHLLDLLRWLMGEVVEVVCRARSSVYQELDDFVMLCTCAGGQSCAFSS